MNKLITVLLFTLSFSSLSAITLKEIEVIQTPKEWKEVKSAYAKLEDASKSLETKDDEKMVIAILKAYAKISKKEKSLSGLESFAPYYKNNMGKVKLLAAKHLEKDEAESIIFGLSAMAENIGKGNDPSVKN